MKCWNAKFRKNFSEQVAFSGYWYSDDIDIANEFANHFSSVYGFSSTDMIIRNVSDSQSNNQNTAHKLDSDMPNLVSVELITKRVNNHKL